MSKAILAGTIVGGGAVLGSIAYLLSSQKKPTVATIQLNGSPTSIGINGSVTWIAFAYDSNNNPVANIPIALVDQTTQTTINMGNTTTTGSVSADTTFSKAGTYVLIAEYNKIKSNAVTITVATKNTTCSCCQKYSETLGQCVDLTASNIALSVVSVPAELYLHMFSSYAEGFGGWNWTNASGKTLGSEVLIPIGMLITDSDGNTVCATGSCADAYTVYGSLSASQSSPYKIPAPGNLGATGYFYFTINYYVTDAQGNRFNTYKGDTNGKATAYLMLSLSDFGYDALVLGSETDYTTLTPSPITFYAGFESGSETNVLPIPISINVTMDQYA